MAFAEIGSGSRRNSVQFTGTAAPTIAYPGSQTPNSLLIITGSIPNSITINSIQDDSGVNGDWNVLYKAGVNGVATFIGYVINQTGAVVTITVNLSASANGSMGIDEFEGNSPLLSVDGSFTEGTSNSPSDGITTATDDELIIGTMYDQGGTSITVGAPATEFWQQIPASGGRAGSFRIVTTAGAYTMNWTLGNSQVWMAQTASFKETGAPPPTALPFRTTIGAKRI